MRVDYAMVKKLIMDGEIEKALDLLVIETNGTEFSMEVALLSAREMTLRKKISSGVLDRDDVKLERNQIVAAVLDLLDRLEEDFLKNKMTYEWFKLHPMALDEEYPDDFETIKGVKTFKIAETSIIGWMIRLNYPPMVADFDFNLEWFFTYNKSPIMEAEIHEVVLPIASMSMYQGSTFEISDPKEVPLGDYTFELFYRGKSIVSEAFTVV